VDRDPDAPPEVERTELPEPPDWEWKRPEPAAPLPKASTGAEAPKGLGLAFAIGYSFVGPVVGGVLIGSLIDGKSGGTFTVVGLLVGTVLAFALLIRLVNKLNNG
jgi:F0F1-type ATP synthase assembly protein I